MSCVYILSTTDLCPILGNVKFEYLLHPSASFEQLKIVNMFIFIIPPELLKCDGRSFDLWTIAKQLAVLCRFWIKPQ